MQITLDVSTLTAAERSHVIHFIADYPTSQDVQDNASDDEVIATVPSFTFPEPEEDEEVPTPEVAFGPSLVPPPPTAYIVPPPPVRSIAEPVAPVAPAGVELDKNGLPWDDRIHASSKVFVADGTWRQRRGVDKAVVAQVEAELRAIMNIPAAVIPPPPPPVNPTFAAPVPPPPPPPAPVVAITNLPTATPIASIAAPTTPVAPLEVVIGPEPNAYLNLIQLVTDVISKKMITRPQVDACITGVDPSLNLQLLSKRPDLIPQIAANIRTLVA